MSYKDHEIILIDSDSDSDTREQSPHPTKIQRTNNNNTIYNDSARTLSSTSLVNKTPISNLSSEVNLNSLQSESDNEEVIENETQVSHVPSDDSGDSDLEEVSFDDDVDSVSQGSSSPGSENELFTKQDTAQLRYYLKINGSMKFLDKYLPVTLSSLDLLNLLKLLGFKPRMGQITDEEEKLLFLIKFLQRAMNKVLMMRLRIKEFNTVDIFVEQLKLSKKIMVLTGAGISTSLGIPDFRSSQGFYVRLQHLGLDDPQEVFDLDYFREDPTIFYSIAHMIVPPENAYTPLHAFIKLLQDKGKLLRNYTQNIDNLESNVGIDREKLIQCHGSFATLSCITCGFQVPGNTIFEEIRLQELPICPWCKSKRNKLDEEVQGSYGVMKPGITFFGELLPGRFHNTIKQDIQDCDLLICIGTSLKVAPVSNIVNLIPASVPQILINKDPVTHCEFDVSLLGYCDQVITYVCDKLGWDIKHENFQDIKKSGLQCDAIKPELGVYLISDKNSRDLSLESKEEVIPKDVNGVVKINAS